MTQPLISTLTRRACFRQFFKAFIFLAFSLGMLSSCKKENTPTAGQIMAARLKADLKDASLQEIYIYDHSSNAIIGYGEYITIDDAGTAVIDGRGGAYRYNLGLLQAYTFAGGHELHLYF